MANTDSSPLTSWRELRKNLNVAADVLDRALKRGRSGSLAHFEALAYLAETPDHTLPQSDIQFGLGLSQSATSRMLSRLESIGLVRRALSKQDGRAWLIELTPAGLNAIQSDLKEFIPVFRVQIHEFAKSLLPFSASGAASLLLPEATADADEPPTEGLLKVGEAILSLDQDSSFVVSTMVVREALEHQIMLDAAANATEEDVESLQAILDEMELRLTEPKKFFLANWRLLRHILELGENELLKELYSGLLAILEEHFQSVVSSKGLTDYLSARLSIERELVAAIATGEPELVRAATEQHAIASRVSAIT